MKASEARFCVKNHSEYLSNSTTELDYALRQINCHANFGMTAVSVYIQDENVLKELGKLGFEVSDYRGKIAYISW